MTETRLGSRRGNPAYKRNKKFLVNENINIYGTPTCTKCFKPNLVGIKHGQKQTHDVLTIDHILPLSKGGTNERFNLRVMCYECNQARGNSLDE